MSISLNNGDANLKMINKTYLKIKCDIINIKMSDQQTFKLYDLDDYNKTLDFINKSFVNVSLKKLEEELIKKKGYHCRIVPTQNYIFYGDCDHYKGDYNSFVNLLINFLDQYYNINVDINEISYTINDSKNGSFHYSIPKFYANAKKLQEIHENFLKCHEDLFIYINEEKKRDTVVDVSVYGKKWFRYPNQLKASEKGTEHIIKHGLLIDFIIDHIPDYSLCIDDKPYLGNNKSNKKTKINIKNNDTNIHDENSDILNEVIDAEINENLTYDVDDFRDILSNLSQTTVDSYMTWMTVGRILKNHSIGNNLFNEWMKWSAKSNKFEKNNCEYEWKCFKKMKDGVKIGTLLMMLKKDNKNKYDEIIKQLKIKKVIQNNKEYFPDNDLKIDKIISNNNSHYIELADKYCPIIKNNHDKRYTYMEMNKFGQLVLKCYCDTCRGQEFPSEHTIYLKKEDIQSVFSFTQINNNINININNGNNDNDNYEKIKINQDAVIFKDQELNKLMINSFSGCDTDIAKMICYLAKGKYCCSQEKQWYQFFNHRWQENESINNFISDDIVEYYKEVIKYVESLNNLSKIDKTITIKEVIRIIKMLKSVDSKNKIVIETGRRFRINNKNFHNDLDATPYIIGFNNGVYDLDKMEFRDGKPEDMISMTCGYDFSNEYSEHKEELEIFLEEILPIKEDRIYFLTYLSSGLIGLNVCELFTILTGKGRNGKSKLIDLIAITTGDYFGRPKCKLLTGSRPDENSPEPGLLSLKRKRIIAATEPEKNDKLNSGFIKFITGNDTETLRKCHKNEMEFFKANFITFLVCNDIPEIDNIDIAFTKRLRCINFPTEFTLNPNEKISHQKLIDQTLQLKIPLWKNDFMLLLIEYLKIFKGGKLIPSENVLKWTNEYSEDVDRYYNFLQECTEESDNHISNVELYTEYKYWYKTKYPGEKIPNVREFLCGIRKHKNVERSVFINNKTTSGIKNLKKIDWYTDVGPNL